jgi:hypothetical protein
MRAASVRVSRSVAASGLRLREDADIARDGVCEARGGGWYTYVGALD